MEYDEKLPVRFQPLLKSVCEAVVKESEARGEHVRQPNKQDDCYYFVPFLYGGLSPKEKKGFMAEIKNLNFGSENLKKERTQGFSDSKDLSILGLKRAKNAFYKSAEYHNNTPPLLHLYNFLIKAPKDKDGKITLDGVAGHFDEVEFLLNCTPKTIYELLEATENELPDEGEGFREKDISHDSKPPILELPKTNSSINHYTNRVIEQVLSRDDEQQYLRDFLDGEETFSWLQLAGVAGQGKSRLALELMLEARKDDRWAAGEFRRQHFNAFTDNWNIWKPHKPHLFVIDYVIGNEDWIRSFFHVLLQREDFHYPVRVLLIERQRWDKGGFLRPRYRQRQQDDDSQSVLLSADLMETDSYAEWFLALTKTVNDSKTDNAEHNDYIQSFISTKFGNDGILELKKLDEDALFSITKRIAKSNGVELKMLKPDVIKRLNQIDRSGRPLYAYFFGQALAAGDGKDENIYSRDELLRDALKRQYQKRWAATFGRDTPIRRDDNIAHRLAVIATIVKGLDYKEAKEHKPPRIPHADADSIRRAMIYTDTPPRTDDEHAPGNIILPLEPDILGEWMVLDSFNEALPVDELLDMVWHHNPKETAAFIQRLTQDFPDHPTTAAILENDTPDEQSLVYFSQVSSAILYNLYQYDKEHAFSTCLIKGLQYAAETSMDTIAMFNFGTCYAYGRGVEQSDETAVEWYRKAADKGQADAMFNLGVCYAYGRGVEQSYETAVEWYRKAADKDHPNAMYILVKCYVDGRGVEQSYETAVEWCRKAADKYHAGEMSMFNLWVVLLTLPYFDECSA